ncbi:probable ubiquitin-conjugating enzyme E2 24 [Durio zibethinus]|uniref:E2 ubiquitin-conjugating enzyme n=1 Tax=Durio zibethinus TaxID=66656 RepID=A0A6P5X4I3_DURZI|nr:probable ubiquitin-conjugating enzyme E2 24 [Durio zibethinus]XP_022723293.1 probable ubiquitin-conjugating enzyme E2 24 [Durio zibethinus]XP_022723294.1 probable ubiquitin-conjugating enzyme E2 24 [Durio zibethinus]
MDVLLTDSDWESFSESGSSEEQEENDFLYAGQACNILSSLEESIEKIDDFLSFERGFIHGDIVRSVTDPCGQMGRVTNINMFVDLENVHGKIIKDINSKQLLKIRSISVGDYVVNATWIGRVDKVVDCVSIVFDDGSTCEVTAVDHNNLVPVSPNIMDDSQYPYYPGQRVLVVPSNVSRSTRWLCGTWRENQNEGTVSGVAAAFVYVDWISSAHVDHDLSASPPSRLQEAKDLTLLLCFSHANWQLGDWCMLSFADHKGITEKFLHASTHDKIKGNWKLEKGFKRGNLGRLAEIFVIIKTRTKVDVVWQDGSCGWGLDSQTLLPVGVANAHEFWPNQFVLEKGTGGNSQRWGVVHGMDAKERTVKVQWRNMAVNQVNGYGEHMEETVSAYELVEHPDYSYCFGDIVFKVAQNQFGDQADKGHIISETGFGTEAAFKGNNCNWNHNKYPSTCYLSCIGIVIGFKDGDVEVKWASGNQTKVAPFEIYGIDKYEDSATSSVLYEENTEVLNQEMIVNEMQSNNQKGKDLLNFDGADESGKKFSWMRTSFFRPQAAIGFFSSIASSILGSLGSTSLFSQESSGCISHDAKEYGILLENEELETCNHYAEHDLSELQIFETANIKLEVEEIEENEGSMMPRSGETSDQFRQFDMVSDCSDHHFLGESKVLAVSQVKRSWLKKVQQEWSILEKNLPETIYVRVYEERMDLLRAALVGAPGTPYHDGLFFFDIFLPPEYPYEPPLVHYHSRGLRLNPNLYESGKICLSLLNTWTGSDTEVWNPEISTILQVLVSLQALVLNEKPYFNEAGFDKQLGRADGETNSVSYNENAFLVTCQSMLYILRKPPKHFEALVKEHFSRRAKTILSACTACMEGAPVGFALECGGNEHDENFKASSTGFKIMLAKLFPKLVEAFSDQGIECSQFRQLEK